MGKIVLSPRILGDSFGSVVLQHIDYYAELNKLNKSEIAKDLNGARFDEYVKLFNKYFKDDLKLKI